MVGSKMDAASMTTANRQGQALTRDQLDLVDILRNELAELVEQDFDVLESGSIEQRREFLTEQQQHLDNIGNASDMVGLHGLCGACHQLAKNFGLLAESLAIPDENGLLLLQSWGIYLLGYLEYIGDEDNALNAVHELLEFLADPSWAAPLDEQEAQSIMEHFRTSNLSVDDDALAQLPETITGEMVSLELGDARQELIQGLLTELPELVRQFEHSIGRYLDSANFADLAPAQRLAHTIKGSANVVGIAGAANLMHYVEDMLEFAAKSGMAVGDEFRELLQDAADCLAAMADYLAGLGPEPSNSVQVMTEVVHWVRQFRSADTGAGASDIPQTASSEELSAELGEELPEELREESVEDHSKELAEQPAEEFLEEFVEEFTNNEYSTAAADAWLAEVDSQLLSNGEKIQSGNPNALFESTEESKDESTVIKTEPQASLVENAVTVTPATAAASSRDDVLPQQNLVIADTFAQELLRLAGETQIINTQGTAQLDQLAVSIKAAEAYHKDIVAMSSELEQQVQMQGALAMAGMRQSDEQMDPLELERYNELHSFSHKLLELTTDSHEAMERMSDQIKTLKALMHGQQQLNRDNQQLVLQLRMVSVKTMTSRFTRCLRQACRLTGKKAQLIIEGEDILMDSRVLHQVADPIMHLIRNAVDHSLEDSEARLAAGKSADGLVRLNFSLVGETIVIHCSDDGRGLDYQRIATVARQRGLADDEFLADTGNLRQLIMMPGFTTQNSVSHTSGRGIGLDAVVDQVRELKGHVTLESEAGSGCRFTLQVPSSILSGHAILVRTRGSAGDHILSVVTRSVEQIIHLTTNDLQREGKEIFYTKDDEKLTVYEFNDLTQIHLQPAEIEDKALLLTRRADGSRFGVLVESVTASLDLVIKPLGRFTFKPQGVVGATILGNGAVSPVVDLKELPGASLGGDELALARAGRLRLAEHQGIAGHQNKPMVLIVDDSLSARRSLAQFVTDMGLDVRTARDGFEAIQVVDQQHPVLMLVDLEMPRMNGLELTAHLRSRPETQQIPIVMITSRSTDKHRRMAEVAGVNDYLNKPWSDDALLSAIQAQLQSSNNEPQPVSL